METITAVFLDIEGTLRFKGSQVAGAADAVNELRRRGYVVRFTTNIDSRLPQTISRELASIGIAAAPEEIFTPVDALLRFLEERPEARSHFLLSTEVRPLLERFAAPEGDTPDYVVVGDFRTCFTYQSLNQAFRHLMKGAELVAMQRGLFFFGQDAELYLDTGAFVSLLERATGKEALVLGKPSPNFFRLALSTLGLSPEQAVSVGDDVTSDVAAAKEAGIPSVLVQTGKYSLQEEERARSRWQADVELPSVAALPRWLAERALGQPRWLSGL